MPLIKRVLHLAFDLYLLDARVTLRYRPFTRLTLPLRLNYVR